jgi:hypothetical protein
VTGRRDQMVMIQAKTKTQNQVRLQGYATSLDVWQQRVEHALRHLGDRSLLNRSPLARLSYIESLSAERYSGHLLPRGLALHDILISCVERVSNELSNEPGLAKACTYLKLLTNGATCREISKQLGLSREHISRVYRKKAIELVTEEFLATVNSK